MRKRRFDLSRHARQALERDESINALWDSGRTRYVGKVFTGHEVWRVRADPDEDDYVYDEGLGLYAITGISGRMSESLWCYDHHDICTLVYGDIAEEYTHIACKLLLDAGCTVSRDYLVGKDYIFPLLDGPKGFPELDDGSIPQRHGESICDTIRRWKAQGLDVSEYVLVMDYLRTVPHLIVD